MLGPSVSRSSPPCVRRGSFLYVTDLACQSYSRTAKRRCYQTIGQPCVACSSQNTVCTFNSPPTKRRRRESSAQSNGGGAIGGVGGSSASKQGDGGLAGSESQPKKKKTGGGNDGANDGQNGSVGQLNGGISGGGDGRMEQGLVLSRGAGGGYPEAGPGPSSSLSRILETFNPAQHLQQHIQNQQNQNQNQNQNLSSLHHTNGPPSPFLQYSSSNLPHPSSLPPPNPSYNQSQPYQNHQPFQSSSYLPQPYQSQSFQPEPNMHSRSSARPFLPSPSFPAISSHPNFVEPQRQQQDVGGSSRGGRPQGYLESLGGGSIERRSLANGLPGSLVCLSLLLKSVLTSRLQTDPLGMLR
jgi:hypothetical protein